MSKNFTYFAYSLLFAFSMCVQTAWAQPTNDDCSGAIPISPSAAGTGCGSPAFNLPFSSDGTTDSGMDGSCNGTNTGLDQFFTWTATTVGLLWNDASPGNPGIIIWENLGTSGSPSCGAEIDCEGTFATTDATLSGWTIGDDLIIQIYDFGTSVSDVAFCLEEYTPPPPPPNDDCSGVIDLGTLSSPLSSNTCDATNDFSEDCLSNPAAQDMVYSIDVPDGSTLEIGQTSNTYDSKHRLAYGGACPGTNLIICRDDSDTQLETWVNTTGSTQTVYWVQSAFSTGCGDFTLAWEIISCIQPTFTVSVDASACPTINITVNVTDLGSAASVDITESSGTDSETGVGLGMYTLTGYAPGDGTITVTVADNADAACNNTADGDIPAACPPPNDLCANAVMITAGSTTSGTTVDATTTGEPGFCGTSVTAAGVWYTYTSTVNEDVTIDLCGAAHDSKINIYTGSCGSFACVIGEDDDCGNDPEVTFTTTAGGSFAPETYFIYVNGFSNGTGAFDITVVAVPLPVTLVSFKGEKMEKGNKLSWVTASEQNTEAFAIERSGDGVHWQAIGQMAAAGFATYENSYEFMDDAPLAKSIYRLRAKDYDGSSELSELLTIERSFEGFRMSNVFPQPVSDELTVQFNNDRNSQISVRLTDLMGRLIYSDSFEANDGANDYRLETSGMASGIYFLIMDDGTRRLTERIVKN